MTRVLEGCPWRVSQGRDWVSCSGSSPRYPWPSSHSGEDKVWVLQLMNLSRWLWDWQLHKRGSAKVA